MSYRLVRVNTREHSTRALAFDDMVSIIERGFYWKQSHLPGIPSGTQMIGMTEQRRDLRWPHHHLPALARRRLRSDRPKVSSVHARAPRAERKCDSRLPVPS